jgi:site-specific recombinase XerD
MDKDVISSVQKDNKTNIFLTDLEKRHYSRHTLVKFKRTFKFFEGKEITSDSIQDYQRYLIPLSTRSRIQYLLCLKRFLKKYYPKLMRYLVIPRLEKRLIQDIPSEDDINLILEKPDTSTQRGIIDRCLMELLYATGIRRSELIHLKVEDIDIQKKIIRIQQGKYGKDRLVVISTRAVAWLNKYLQWIRPNLIIDSNYIFLNRKGQKLSVNTPIRRLQKYGEFSPHKYRHAYATHLLKKGMKETSLQRLLGHSEVTTTQIYAKVTILDLHERYRKFHRRDTWKV